MKKIYAFLDNVSNDIAGPLQIHHHPAAAVRLFGDVARMENSELGKHIHDFDLVCLGEINDAWSITGRYEIIMTGTAWANAQMPKDNNQTALEV